MDKSYRKNREITASRVLLITPESDRPAEMDIASALRAAADSDLDLVEIAPNQTPPVCKLMDYGSFRYRESKKTQENQKKARSLEIKELRFRPGTGDADLQTKTRQAAEFLRKGHHVKATVRLRGREMAHPEMGLAIIERLGALLSDCGQPEQPGRLEGRQIQSTFLPRPAGKR